MRRRVLIGCGVAVVVLVLGAVALLSGQEAVRRNKAQAQLEEMLDFAYGPLTYKGEVFSGDEVSGQDYIIFEDDYYTYQLDAGSGALKSMIARHLPQDAAVTRTQLEGLIAQAQPVLKEKAEVSCWTAAASLFQAIPCRPTISPYARSRWKGTCARGKRPLP